MPIRFSLSEFLKAAGAATTGYLQGQLQGQMEQEAMERQQREEQMRQFGAVADILLRQEAERRGGLETLGRMQLTPEAQARVGEAMGRPSAIPAGLAAAAGRFGLANIQGALGGEQPAMPGMAVPSLAPMAPPQMPADYFGAMPGMEPPVTPGGPQVQAGAGMAMPGGAEVGRQFQVPGVGMLEISGVKKGEAEALQRQFVEAEKPFRDVDLSDDPAAQARVARARTSFPAQIQTPEDVAQARAAIAALNAESQGLGPRVEGLRQRRRERAATVYESKLKNLETASPAGALGLLKQMEALEAEGATDKEYNLIPPTLAGFSEEMAELRRREEAKDRPGALRQAVIIQDQLKRRVEPARESQAINSLVGYLSKLPTSQARDPKFVREQYIRRGLGYLIEGLPDDQMPFIGGARADERLHQVLLKISSPQFAVLDGPSQRAILDEAAGLARATGQKISIPEKVIADMTPYQRALLGQRKQEFGLRFGLDQRRVQVMEARDKRDAAEARSAIAKLSDVQKKELSAMDGGVKRGYDSLQTYMQTYKLNPSQIDAENPRNDWEAEYVRQRDALRNLLDQRDEAYRRYGIRTPVEDVFERPAPVREEAPPPPVRKTLIQKAADLAYGLAGRGTAAPAGAAAAAPAREQAAARPSGVAPPARPSSLTPQENAYFGAAIRKGKFDLLMAHPELQDPDRRVKAKRAYREMTGKEWGGIR